MFLGLALNCSHFDAANLDRLNIDGPLHFQTGMLFETLQAFGAMVLWVSTVNDISLAVFRRQKLSLAELVWPFNRLNIDGPSHMTNLTVVLFETLQALTATVLWASWYFSITQDRAHGFRIQGKTGPVPRATSQGKKRSAAARFREPRENPEDTCLWQCPLFSDMAQENMIGFVKTTAADDGHDADHVHLDLFTLIAGIIPTGVFACHIKRFW